MPFIVDTYLPARMVGMGILGQLKCCNSQVLIPAELVTEYFSSLSLETEVFSYQGVSKY